MLTTVAVARLGSPRIGVTWVSPGRETSEHYLRSVAAAGGEPVPLVERATSWAVELATLRGLLLTGGGDIDPQHYGAVNQGSRGIIPQRDEMEMEALRFCLARGLPVLGICRGMQVINVALGGSLLQDIPSSIISSIEHRANGAASSYHAIQLQPNTLLARVVGNASWLRVNSRHHQGLIAEQLAPGLSISALAPDGIVEGLEAEDERFILGVQCHPERPGEAPEMVALFDTMVAWARAC